MFTPLFGTIAWSLAPEADSRWLLFGTLDSRDIHIRIQEISWVLVFTLALVPAWVALSIIRFRRGERRCHAPRVVDDAQRWLADYHQLPQSLLPELGSRREVVWRDGMQEPVEVEAWLQQRENGAQSALHPAAQAVQASEPTVARAARVAVFVIFLLAVLLVILRLHEGMP